MDIAMMNDFKPTQRKLKDMMALLKNVDWKKVYREAEQKEPEIIPEHELLNKEVLILDGFKNGCKDLDLVLYELTRSGNGYRVELRRQLQLLVEGYIKTKKQLSVLWKIQNGGYYLPSFMPEGGVLGTTVITPQSLHSAGFRQCSSPEPFKLVNNNVFISYHFPTGYTFIYRNDCGHGAYFTNLETMEEMAVLESIGW